MSKARQIPIQIAYSENFRRIYAKGAMGEFTGHDFRMRFWNDILTLQKDPNALPIAQRIIEVEIILSPLALKQLRDWLIRNVKEVEEKIGEIKEPTGRPSPPKPTAKPYG